MISSNMPPYVRSLMDSGKHCLLIFYIFMPYYVNRTNNKNIQTLNWIIITLNDPSCFFSMKIIIYGCRLIKYTLIISSLVQTAHLCLFFHVHCHFPWNIRKLILQITIKYPKNHHYYQHYHHHHQQQYHHTFYLWRNGNPVFSLTANNVKNIYLHWLVTRLIGHSFLESITFTI